MAKLINLIRNLFHHKFAASVLLIAIAGGGYYAYKATHKQTDKPSYLTATVGKGELSVSVSGSGQVSGLNQLEIKPKVAGDVLEVTVKQGQIIPANAVLARLDNKEAQKTVGDAQINLESSRLALEKLQQPSDELSRIQATNAVITAKNILEKLKRDQETDYQKAKDDVAKAYEDAFNSVSSAFLDLPTIITGLYDTLYSTEIAENENNISDNEWNTTILFNQTHIDDRSKLAALQTSSENDYKTARTKYDANLVKYNSASRYSDRQTVEILLAETLETSKTMAQAAKSENSYLDAWIDYRVQRNQKVFGQVTEYKNNLNIYIGQTNGHISTLLTIQGALKDNLEVIKQADLNNPKNLVQAENSAREKEAAQIKLLQAPDQIDIASQQLTIRQRQATLADALSKLSDYTITSPIEGLVATVNIKKGDQATSGVSAFTIITNKKIVKVALNEVDVVKVKPGQKCALTFDAITDLTIAGEVGEVETIGVASQGVVSYMVSIIFDTEDERVRAGMSVSATIVSEIKQDVLLAPNSSVKDDAVGSYVEVLTGEAATERRAVRTGISNDSFTEIITGLRGGERIITKTVQASAEAGTQNQTQRNNGLLPGLGGGGGGQSRFIQQGGGGNNR